MLTRGTSLFNCKRLSASNSKGILSGGNSSFEPMTEQKAGSAFGSVLSVGKLFEVRKSALRHGIWYRALSRIERGVVDLTVRYVDCIRSTKLAKVLTAILDKLALAAESVVDKMVKSFGFAQARKISGVALSWGYIGALAWAVDRGFARFLAVMHLNGSGFFRA